jgi:hypothetical protein
VSLDIETEQSGLSHQEGQQALPAHELGYLNIMDSLNNQGFLIKKANKLYQLMRFDI